MICKICGSDENKFIGRPRINNSIQHLLNHDYKIQECANCNFYFIEPEIDLTQQAWQHLYEDNYFADSLNNAWLRKLREKERKQRLKLIEGKLKCEKAKFLDMGCGEGDVLKEAIAHGFEAYGVDIAHNLSQENSGINFFKGNIFEAKFPDAFFSVIYMDSVLEHVLNPMETLAELRRILKPGGVLLVIVPNEDSFENSFIHLAYSLSFRNEKYGKIKPFVTPYHVNGFNAVSLKTAIDKSMFHETEIKGFGGSYTFWKASKFGSKQYMQALLTYPVGLLSVIFKKQIQLMAVAIK